MGVPFYLRVCLWAAVKRERSLDPTSKLRATKDKTFFSSHLLRWSTSPNYPLSPRYLFANYLSLSKTINLQCVTMWHVVSLKVGHFHWMFIPRIGKLWFKRHFNINFEMMCFCFRSVWYLFFLKCLEPAIMLPCYTLVNCCLLDMMGKECGPHATEVF